MSSIEQEVDVAERLLELDRRLVADRRDHAEHEVLGGEVDDLPRRIGAPRGARDGMEEMRLAAADPGMDVERIEAVERGALGDRLGGGEGHAVGHAVAEALERVARVDRRAAEMSVGLGAPPGLGRRRGNRRARGRGRDIGGDLGLRLRGLGPHRAAHDDLDLEGARPLLGPQREQAVIVVRADPRLEEPRRHRQVDGALVGGLELRPAEPAAEDVLSNLGPKPLFHALPRTGIRPIRHEAALLSSPGQAGIDLIVRFARHQVGSKDASQANGAAFRLRHAS